MSNLIKTKCKTKKICGFEPAKMHFEFAYTTNAFQDESWDLSNFIYFEGSLISLILKFNFKLKLPSIINIETNFDD